MRFMVMTETTMDAEAGGRAAVNDPPRGDISLLIVL